MSPTADEIRNLLALEAHPTCGFVRESFRSPTRIPAAALPSGYDGDRAQGSVLYFLVTPDAHMALHRIRPDQMYHHYLGDPLEVLLLHPDATGEVVVVGPDLQGGHRPQLFIPGQTWHVSRLLEGGKYALLATTEWPGVEPADVEEADPERLTAEYPSLADQIASFAGVPRGGGPLRAPDG
jgi:predicted cupin superfamily sugar epimerase